MVVALPHCAVGWPAVCDLVPLVLPVICYSIVLTIDYIGRLRSNLIVLCPSDDTLNRLVS